MVGSLVNSIEFYANLGSTGYIEGVRRAGPVRPIASSQEDGGNSNAKDINQVNINRVASENIGQGTESSYKTSGVYVDILYPQYAKQSPISKPQQSFKSVLEVLINRPDYNSRIYSRPEAKKAESSVKMSSTNSDLNIEEKGYVLTVPGEHMDKLNESRSPATLKDKLYELYNSNPYDYSGSLVNVTA
ncbi:MAG: hypothetical protein Q8940_14435 [Bacteroidota bacterium]|nr:hypothetical protein [Bacteroidota bacterium]